MARIKDVEITVSDVQSTLDQDLMIASNTRNNRLSYNSWTKNYKVVVNKEVVYLGLDMTEALTVFNEIA